MRIQVHFVHRSGATDRSCFHPGWPNNVNVIIPYHIERPLFNRFFAPCTEMSSSSIQGAKNHQEESRLGG